MEYTPAISNLMVWLVAHAFSIDERSKAKPHGPTMRKNRKWI